MTRGHRLPLLNSRRLAAGLSVSELARRANLSDDIVNDLEAGGNCDPQITERLCNAIAPPVAIVSSSVANPTVVTTAANAFVSGDTVTIANHTSTPTINGDRVATVTADTTFTVPVNVTGGGSATGTVSLSPTSLGIVRI